MNNATYQRDLPGRFRVSICLGISSVLVCLAPPLAGVADESWPVPEWQSVPVAEHLFPEGALAPVLAFALEQNSRALLVVRGGRLESEHYFGDWTTDQNHGLASAAKSITSLLTGIAIAEKRVPDVKTPVSHWFPGFPNADAILADLLTMRGGLPYEKKLQVAMHRAPDWLAFIRSQPLARPPGERFLYSGFDPILLAAVLQKATAQPLDAFAQEKLFTPLGITGTVWEGDERGLINGGSQLAMTARDLARIGLLCLRQGRWQDRQIVPADWLETSISNQVGGAPWYGYYWWKLPGQTEASDPRLAGCYFASGGGGQHLIVLPRLDLAIVRLGSEPQLTPSGQKFVPELLRLLLASAP
jgi:CubicO group peptidase (beta-lactamase class C family)